MHMRVLYVCACAYFCVYLICGYTYMYVSKHTFPYEITKYVKFNALRYIIELMLLNNTPCKECYTGADSVKLTTACYHREEAI